MRDVRENLARGFAGRRTEGVNIALLHSNVGGRKGHENYAPCSLDDLRAAGMDYWALGHVHSAEILCHDPLVVYPGNIQGRHIGETGQKGVVSVAMGSGRASRRERRRGVHPCVVRGGGSPPSKECSVTRLFAAFDRLRDGVRNRRADM